MLQLKALGIDNILGFDWLASPSSEAMIRALEVLYSLGVLDSDAKLTSPDGFQVAEIPLVCYCHQHFNLWDAYILLNYQIRVNVDLQVCFIIENACYVFFG